MSAGSAFAHTIILSLKIIYEDTSEEPVCPGGIYELTQRHYVFPDAVLFDHFYDVKSECDQTDVTKSVGIAADV